MKTGTKFFGFAALAFSLVTLSGCGGGSSSNNATSSGGGGNTNASNQWTWVGGSNVAGAAGSYGTQGNASSSNVPAARTRAVTWTDSSGNFYLFGGINSQGPLSDLWKYSPSSGQWTWLGGSSSPNQSGNYGSLGIQASSNQPGSRSDAVAWKDASGNFYLMGGIGVDATGTSGHGIVFLNDLWKYNLGANQWTWLGGSDFSSTSSPPHPAIYGVQGTADANNFPGVRADAAAWSDSSGNLWLFGGQGGDVGGQFGALSDLWEYATNGPNAGKWTWVAGPNSANQASVGTVGSISATNTPSGRYSPAVWVDSSNNLWLYGGNQTTGQTNYTPLSDLWKFSTTGANAGKWTWVAGSSSANTPATYGTQGTAAAANTPGARVFATSWTDASGNLWLFGGSGVNNNGTVGIYNDLWKFSTASGQWTWVNGPNSSSSASNYGTQGTSTSSTIPGGRISASSWIDSSSNLWLFGGQGFDSSNGSASNVLNDLWKYKP